MDFPSVSLGPPIAKRLSRMDVQIEANRCLNCYDAPCMRACPTAIDVPRFIGRIATGDLLGSAHTIMDANPVGASCARVCPTDQLCEGACVYNADENPIRIGDLQRYATDWAIRPSTSRSSRPDRRRGKRVAVVGGGPAGLAAARELARIGHAVTIFERDPEPGGLDTYGIVPFRLPAEIALWEAEQVRALGVEFRTGVASVGETIASADAILADYDAVVIAVGMGERSAARNRGRRRAGVWDALDFIRIAKMGGDVGVLGEHVAIIGGGNTAIDAATCSSALGCAVGDDVLPPRRGADDRVRLRDRVRARSKASSSARFVLPKRIIVETGASPGSS